MIFKELRYILAVKECGNLSKAAEKLYLTQPALSRYIKNLEDSLDIKLFEHSGRKLILTDAGLRYVDAAYKMLDMYEDLLNDLHASDDMIRGSLRIGTTRQRGPMLLPSIVSEFHRAFPNVNLSLFEENSYTLEKMLANGDLDIIIEKGPVTNIGSFEKIPLFTEELLCVVSNNPSFLGKFFDTGNVPDRVNPTIFKDELFVLLKPGHHTRYMSERIFEDCHFFPENYIEISNVETVVRIIDQIQGVTFLPSYFASGENQRIRNLQTFSIDGLTIPPIFSTFNIIYREEYPLTRYAQAFIDITQEKFGNISE